MKYSKYYKKIKNKEKNMDMKWLSKLLLSVIVVLVFLILTNFDSDIRYTVASEMLDKNINFGYIKNLYNKYVGGEEIVDEMVVSLTNPINYEKYNDSYKVKVDNDEGIGALSSGIIVYIGDKEDLGSSVIIQGNDGVDIWYSNVSFSSYGLYDYVSKGDILGSSLSDYYLFTLVKDGEKLKYEEYFG